MAGFVFCFRFAAYIFRMDLSSIISVSGMSGLYKVVAQTRTGLLVESMSDGKRFPVYSTTRVSALEDISIYGNQDDIPLKDVFASIMKQLDGAAYEGDLSDTTALKAAFGKFLPEYDAARVYTSDIKKVFVWYNLLLEKNLLTAPDPEEKKEEKKEDKKKSEAANKPATAKAKPKSAAPKASSKGMAKTQTVRKTGA